MKTPRNENGVPVVKPNYEFIEEKLITFDGGTVNAIGDHDGTGDPFTIFTVTGTVIAKVFGVCELTLAGATATVEVGVTGDTAALIAQSTATDLTTGELWHDATPTTKIEAITLTEKFIANGLDVIGTVGTANITAGQIRFFCIWYPISADGNVVAA